MNREVWEETQERLGPHHTMKTESLGRFRALQRGPVTLWGPNLLTDVVKLLAICANGKEDPPRLSHLVGAGAAKNSLCLKPLWGEQRWVQGLMK